jgi:hypothetical protein
MRAYAQPGPCRTPAGLGRPAPFPDRLVDAADSQQAGNRLEGYTRCVFMGEPIIVCPKCHSDIPLTESLAAPLLAATRRVPDAHAALGLEKTANAGR